MPHLTIKTLGTLDISLDGQPIKGFRSVKVQALLVYLAVESDRAHRRDAIIDFLWPDSDPAAANANFRQSLSRLRKALKAPADAPPFLLVTRESVQWNRASDAWLDVDLFNSATDSAESLPTALSHYNGDFLTGFSVTDAPDFELWASAVRERLHQQTLDHLRTLAQQAQRRGAYADATRWAQRIVAIEPWDEAAHALLMRLLTWQGQRGAALQQYDQLTEILWDELGVKPAADVAQLRQRIADAPGVRPHNLPQPTTPFFGRNADLIQLNTYLADPDARIITLVGAGGIGKTRLALEATQRAVNDYLGPFWDGVFFVALSAIDAAGAAPNTAAAVAVAVADALDWTLTGRSDPRREVLNGLRRRQLLLVLDNAEHLLDDALTQWLTQLAQHALEVKLLVTSRQALDLSGEWLLDLSGLAYPTGVDSAGIQPDAVAQYDAITLFTQRAQQSQPTFVLTDATVACTIRICQLVDGMPLALELAAGWMNTLSCDEIAREIDYNVDVLASRRRDLPARHRSLRAVFDYSWVLLTPAEQSSLLRLAVFRGGFERDAARAVAHISLFALDALVAKSWLRQTAADGVTRFHMLEPLRQYAGEQLGLSQHEDEQTVRDQHAAYYLALVADQREALHGRGQLAALQRIMRDSYNVQQAWTWATERAQVSLLDAALPALFDALDMRSRYQDGLPLFRQAAAAAPAWPASALRERFMARLRGRLGWFAFLTGDVAAGVALLEESMDAADGLGLVEDSVFSRNYLGALLRLQGVLDSAESQLTAALTLAQSNDDQFGASIALNNLSQIAAKRDDLTTAQALCRESLALKRALGDQRGAAFSLVYLGRIALAQADVAAAEPLLTDGLAIYRALDDRRGMALTMRYLGDAAAQNGDADAAHAHYVAAARLFEAMGTLDEADATRARLL